MAADPPTDQHDVELRFATMEQIVAEIRRRKQAMLVAYLDDVKSDADEDAGIGVYYGGGRVACYGLAEWAKSRLIAPPDVSGKTGGAT